MGGWKARRLEGSEAGKARRRGGWKARRLEGSEAGRLEG
jgi:hypothetical protein